LAVLIVMSIVTLGVGLERLTATLRCRKRLRRARQDILGHLQAGSVPMALAVNSTGAWHPATPLFELVLGARVLPLTEVKRNQNRVLRAAKQRLWLLGSIGSIAPFVGLLGTVLGVMEAFRAMGAHGAGGFEVVSAGLSEALVTTAAGIFVGIESMLLFNYLQVCLTTYAAELKETVEEVIESLAEVDHGRPAP
jgi:biopolymer transport protein ExbB/TolQ